MAANVTYNPVDPSTVPHDSLVNNIIACAAISWLTAGGLVGLRFYTRGIILNIIGPSDWCILVSWIFAAGITASNIEQTQRGMGRHVWDYEWWNEIIPFQKAAWYGVLFYQLTLCFTKVSILLLYLGLFSYHWVRNAIKLILFAVVISSLWSLCVIFTACIPLRAYWDYTLRTEAYCQPLSMWWSNVGLHMATDFFIFVLPMPVLPTLLMPRRQKLALMAVFSLGFFVCIISIIRLVQLLQTTYNPVIDYSYAGADVLYWTSIEVNAAIVCACVVTLKPLVIKIMPHLLAARRRSLDSPDLEDHPPTVGTKPSRKHLRQVSDEVGHTRGESWLADFPAKMSTGRGAFSEPESSAGANGISSYEMHDFASGKESSIEGEGEASSNADAHELPGPAPMGHGSEDPTQTTALRPPPGAHLRPTQANKSNLLAAGAFFDSASERTRHSGPPSPLLSHPDLKMPRYHPTTSPGFYDSSSERTDWGPERGESPPETGGSI